MSRVVTFIFIAALAGCDAGNYSNEDIDFQLAVPEREDIAVRLPAQALETADSAESYRSTRQVVRDLDRSADAFLSLLTAVRGTAPSERLPDRRIWGPFPIKESPLFLVRLVVQRNEDPDGSVHFAYSIEFRAKAAGPNEPWLSIFNGTFTPGADARHGAGFLHFSAANARAAGYPLGDLAGLDDLTIDYKTNSFPLQVKVTVTAHDAKEGFVYDHQEQQDGSGSMSFTFPTNDPRASLLLLRSRWLGSGAGRADLTVLAGGPLVVGLMGTECWGIDTRPTFIRRPWDLVRPTFGDESTCVFPAPAP